MYKPLEGIRVVDFSTAGAGPSCTKLLSEYGAEVILVEPLSGNSTRDVFKMDFYNTGKKSLPLNVKTPEGMEILLRLVERADVFVSNYRKKALDKLGLTYERLSGLNPRLIYGTITGFGEEGPDAGSPGYDPVAFWARSGMLQDIPERGQLIPTPVAVGDIATGQALAGGICAALYQREKTGRGDRVFISLLAEAVYLNHDAVVQVQYGDVYPQSRKSPRRSMMNTYRCADGKWIVIAEVNFERSFWNLLRAVDREDLVGDPRWTCVEDTMYGGAPEIVEILDEAFGKMTQDEAVAAMKAIDLPAGRVQSTTDVFEDPQCLANNMILNITASDGKRLTIPANPIKFTDKNSGVTDFPIGPKLGADTEAILGELGYSPEQLRALISRGVTMTAGEQ